MHVALVEAESESMFVHSRESLGHLQLLDASDERDCECVCVRVSEPSEHLSPPGCVGRVRLYSVRRGGRTFDMLLSVCASRLLCCLLDPRKKKKKGEA